jgi:Zn-dependent protease/predicted transcriptional regulator
MGGRGWKIGSIGGIPIRLDSSWIWIALLFTYSRYVSVRLEATGQDHGWAIALALLSATLFFGSVLVHELAHAVTARLLGIPVGGITLVFWGGFTETRAEDRGPRGEFLVSAAGPASSLALAGVFWLLSEATARADPSINEMFGWLAFINLILAALNSLPGFPLDGGRALLAGVWKVTGDRRKATRAAAAAGLTIGIALAGIAVLLLVLGGGENLQYSIWGFFIAWWMISAARASDRRLLVRESLARGTAADAMRPPPPTVPADLSLAEALDRYLRGHEQESFPVVDDSQRVLGMVSFRSARRIGAEDPLRPVRDGMIPIGEVRTVQAHDPLDVVVDALVSGGAALVLEGDRLVGSIGSEDLEAWLGGGSASSRSPSTSPAPPRPDR